MTAMNNRGDREMIRDFTELTTDIKSCVINPGLYFMENEASTSLKLTI